MNIAGVNNLSWEHFFIAAVLSTVLVVLILRRLRML